MENDMVSKMVAITVVIVVVAMVMFPILDTVSEGTYSASADNDDPTTAYALSKSTITLTYADSTWTVSDTSVTSIITSGAKIDLASNAVTLTTASASGTVSTSKVNKIVVTNSAVTTYLGDDPVTTISISKIANGRAILVNDTDGTYGLYTPTASAPVYVNDSKNLIAINTASTYIAMEKVSGTTISITATEQGDSDTYPDAYKVTAVASGSGSIVAPIAFSYASTMDDTIQQILGIIPIMVVVGILLACVYMFMQRNGSF